jgi:uncharacterized protein
MLVVSDTSPLTGLIQTRHADLLPTLFETVVIPPSVRDELMRFHQALPSYLHVEAVQDRRAAESLSCTLDVGEAEAIVLAEEMHADYLLIDEKRGRSVAEARGLRVIGALGVLLLGKKARLIPSVAAVIGELELQSGFFVSDEVKQVILRAAGELT